MPLPSANTAWPPVELDGILPAMDRWSAWYSGDPRQLEKAHQHPERDRPSNRPSTYRGGIVGAVARTFWGAPRADLTSSPRKLHVPIAADLCQASADLLFAEPPTFTCKTEKATDRVTELAGDGLLSTIAEAAELAAALGGVYLRVVWDKQVRADGPFLTAVDADGALPEFRWGKMTAVTFWSVVKTDGQQVWRHLERHELDPDGIGVILHSLYAGTTDNLGRVVPLTDAHVTQVLADQVVDGNRISTESPGLAAIYVPNQRPQRLWRTDPLGRHLGRSDLDGVEGLMDALDETYTSWMRDVRLGKARIFASRQLLETTGPGQGAYFDTEQELFVPLAAGVGSMNPGGGSGSATPLLEAQQFKIRHEEHKATAEQFVLDILRTAGYSSQTFGEGSNNVAQTTATEVISRERRSFMTRDRKIRAWRPALADAIEKLMAVDRAMFNGPALERPDVTFGDSVQDSQLNLAQTAQALRTARAASTQTLVAMQHPDWDDKTVQEEVDRILNEDTVPDPLTVVPSGAEAPLVDGQADPTQPQ